MRKAMMALAAGASLWASTASAIVIDFDDLAAGTVVTNQYAEATFSSTAGNFVTAVDYAGDFGTSVPNFIGAGSPGYTAPLYVDFTSAISNLGFFATGADEDGVIGLASVFAGATLLGSVDLVRTGDALTPFFVDLRSYSGVTRLEVTNTDDFGLAYDDFMFDVDTSGAVPEPSTWALLIVGFGLVGGTLRRSRQRVTVAYA